MKIKYSIISRGKMEVEIGEKKTIIYGEITLEPSAFYANINSLKKWEEPFNNEEIPNELKFEIIKSILDESRKEGNVRVFFD